MISLDKTKRKKEREEVQITNTRNKKENTTIYLISIVKIVSGYYEELYTSIFENIDKFLEKIQFTNIYTRRNTQNSPITVQEIEFIGPGAVATFYICKHQTLWSDTVLSDLGKRDLGNTSLKKNK